MVTCCPGVRPLKSTGPILLMEIGISCISSKMTWFSSSFLLKNRRNWPWMKPVCTEDDQTVSLVVTHIDWSLANVMALRTVPDCWDLSLRSTSSKFSIFKLKLPSFSSAGGSVLTWLFNWLIRWFVCSWNKLNGQLKKLSNIKFSLWVEPWAHSQPSLDLTGWRWGRPWRHLEKFAAPGRSLNGLLNESDFLFLKSFIEVWKQ